MVYICNAGQLTINRVMPPTSLHSNIHGKNTPFPVNPLM